MTDKIINSIIRQKLSSRGGGIEISLDTFGFPNEKMAAYQNYLGGGMLGQIQFNDTLRRQTKRNQVSNEDNEKLDKIANQLKRYLHNVTNPDHEWEARTFEENQIMPVASY